MQALASELWLNAVKASTGHASSIQTLRTRMVAKGNETGLGGVERSAHLARPNRQCWRHRAKAGDFVPAKHPIVRNQPGGQRVLHKTRPLKAGAACQPQQGSGKAQGPPASPAACEEAPSPSSSVASVRHITTPLTPPAEPSRRARSVGPSRQEARVESALPALRNQTAKTVHGKWPWQLLGPA